MKRFQLALALATVLVFVPASEVRADSDDDSKFGAWSPASSLGLIVNSPFNDFGPGLTPDGKSLYFSSNRPGGVGLADLWVSQRANKNAAWTAPVNLGPTVNSTGVDSVPSFSRDGRWMFFSSDRLGGLGSNDIWVSFRANPSDDFAWQTPMNVGAPINTAFFDAGPALVEDGNTDILYFNSDRPGGLGGHDFYTSVRRKGGSFESPVLVSDLSSATSDQRLTIRKDGREVFFLATRAPSAGFDLWTSTRDDRDSTWVLPTILSSAVNSASNDFQPTLSRDALTLIFASDRPGGLGQSDLYMTTRMKGD